MANIERELRDEFGTLITADMTPELTFEAPEIREEDSIPESEFKTIPGFENYEASIFGEIRNKKSGRILSSVLSGGNDDSRYPAVSLYKDGNTTTQYVHRLVALTHINNPENKPQVNHIDGNKENNDISNLEWVTAQENIQHSHDNNLNNTVKGEDHHGAKLSSKQVLLIRKRRSTGETYGSIAESVGMAQSTIHAICSGKSWGHL